MLDTLVSIGKSIDLSALVTTLATCFLALLTFIYVRLTRKILEAQTDPCVVLSVISDQERSTIIQLVAKNVGKGLAHDISFDFSRPIPARAFGMTSDKANVAKTMVNGPLVDGIPALGPGEERKIDWGQYGGLIKNIGLEPVIVRCHFKKNGKAMPPVECKLDVKSFEGTVAAEAPIAKVAREVEKISENIRLLASGYHELKVQVTEMSETKAENREEARDRRNRSLPERAGKAWDAAEDQQICEEFVAGTSIADLAVSHNRTPGAIRSRLEKLGKLPPQPRQ